MDVSDAGKTLHHDVYPEVCSILRYNVVPTVSDRIDRSSRCPSGLVRRKDRPRHRCRSRYRKGTSSTPKYSSYIAAFPFTANLLDDSNFVRGCWRIHRYHRRPIVFGARARKRGYPHGGLWGPAARDHQRYRRDVRRFRASAISTSGERRAYHRHTRE